MPYEDHLARHRCADLFLDTFPYNAHTTSSDALWCGLPVLTLSGKSFASRVSGSLLKAIDMADLITHNEADYINKAVRFAKDSKKLSALKAQLNNNVENGKLFNTKIYVENIENAFIQIYNLYKLGHEAKHIFL